MRPDLRMLAMSATPDTKGLLAVLGADTPVAHSDGRMHPVDLVWAPMGKQDRVPEAMAALVQRALREQTGDVLVFLPGIGEIRRVQSLLRGRACPPTSTCTRWPARSSLAEQDHALAPSPPGRRRVVLSTDIAESSLTVDGVRVVVDAGLARVPRFDQRTGMTRLTTVATSRASADQRAGRAGRTEPGVAYRLWSKLEHGTRRAHLEAEITQVDLSGLALGTGRVGHARSTSCAGPTRRPPAALQQGAELLQRLGALDRRRPHHRRAAGACSALPAAPAAGRHGRCRRAARPRRWPASSPRCSTSATSSAADPTTCPPTCRCACAVLCRPSSPRPAPTCATCAGCATGRSTSPAGPASRSTSTR